MARPISNSRSVAVAAAAPKTPPVTREELLRAIDDLVDECRVECLWSVRPDFYPRTDLERQQTLDAIQERSGRELFRRAGRLKAWLSRLSSDASASS